MGVPGWSLRSFDPSQDPSNTHNVRSRFSLISLWACWYLYKHRTLFT